MGGGGVDILRMHGDHKSGQSLEVVPMGLSNGRMEVGGSNRSMEWWGGGCLEVKSFMEGGWEEATGNGFGGARGVTKGISNNKSRIGFPFL